MRSTLLFIAVGSALAGCNTVDQPSKGLATVNVPVVTSTQYVFDAAAPNGALAPGEDARLNGWFQSLGLSYGDAVYVDGGYAEAARAQVAAIAGQYGMLVSIGSPVTVGVVNPGSVRVVVSRRRALVPGCPNWGRPSQPDWDNRASSNFGCSINSNIAAMIADPEDLVHGREGSGVSDGTTATKAVQYYRSAPLTGQKGLETVSPKGGN